ncbi:MAG: nucleotidyltransferase domain-containing protein [Caldilineaceae bacterium]|nr:nucleotidyltransferase domain-containing protein [Caldilineaceae bacterium]
MTVDLQELTAVMTTALLRELGDEVDLIFRYGSFLNGNAHAYSDLDLSYVPVHEETGYHITVTVGEMLCDLYPIRWSQLESMARFENVSSTLLLTYQVTYQRSAAAAARLGQLADQLRTSLQPAARPLMVRKAQGYLQRAGYPYYLLRQQAAAGHKLACQQQAQSIVGIVTHALAIYNQQVVDTRKLDRILALPHLPANFTDLLTQVTHATAPETLLAGCEALLDATHASLLAAQRQFPDSGVTYATAFGAGYPEIKGDLQHILLACERRDLFSLKRLLVSLYHELALAMTKAEHGISYSSFNSLADYEQDFVARGFPALLPLVGAGDFEELHRQCLAFDEHLRHFLTERGAKLYAFATVDDLRQQLAQPLQAETAEESR